jgi:hypothetical protein
MMRLAWLLLLLPALAQAASLQLVWEFDRTFTPAPSRFLITLARPESQDTLSVPPSLPGACGAGHAITPETFCATLPECPADGVYELTVQAEWETLGRSAPNTNLVQCTFSRALPCQCLPFSGPSFTAALSGPVDLTPQESDPPPGPPELPPSRSAPPRQPAPAMPTFPTLPIRGAPS